MSGTDGKYGALHPELLDILQENHRDSVDSAVCGSCAGLCCIQGGPGILENVLLIYEAYKRGELVRSDYEFESGLTLSAFVARYFDVCFMRTATGVLAFFYAKTLTEDNKLTSWNSMDGYSVVDPELRDKVSRSAGCVFLDRKVVDWPDGDPGGARGCILHKPENDTCLTEKPINCVLHTCDAPYNIRHTDAALAAEWLNILAREYPDSQDRFNSLMADEVKAAGS